MMRIHHPPAICRPVMIDDDGCLDIDDLSKEDEETATLGARLPCPQWDIFIILICSCRTALVCSL